MRIDRKHFIASIVKGFVGFFLLMFFVVSVVVYTGIVARRGSRKVPARVKIAPAIPVLQSE